MVDFPVPVLPTIPIMIHNAALTPFLGNTPLIPLGGKFNWEENEFM